MPAPRLASLDLIRGVVMVLMAIDHVRVYSGLPAGGPTPGIFFTRWITHFCAPRALLPAAERAHGALARVLTVFGRVPFFFYVLHIPLIHALAVVVSRVRLGVVSPWLFADHPMAPPPPPAGYTWSVPLLYAVWAGALLILYAACRWFADLKARRRDWWLRYV